MRVSNPILTAEQVWAMKFLKISQVASLLSLGETTVRALIRSGELGACKMGGVYRISVDQFNAFCEASELCRRKQPARKQPARLLQASAEELAAVEF